MSDDKLASMFEEFLLLYKVINRESIIRILKSALTSDQLLEIYQLTDGQKSTREISGMLKNKCSHTTIANLWNKWALIGLVVPAEKKGRYKAAFNLFEYGITTIDEED